MPNLPTLPRTSAVITDGIDAGLHTGAQIYVSLDGEVVADDGIGESRPGVPMDRDTITLWMSSTKPITAVAIGQLTESGKLDLDQPVVDVIPEFGVSGKAPITFRHVLTHTGGFRSADVVWDSAVSWDDIIARICEAPLEDGWVPGEKAGYHVATSWYILAEVIGRIIGTDFQTYVQDAIFTPVGMDDSWIGIPEISAASYGDRIAWTYHRVGGNLEPHGFFNEEAGIAIVRPGGNGRGPIRELGRFYEMLLAGGIAGENRILEESTVEDYTARHRVDMYDETFRHKMDWGLGFIPSSARYGEPTVPYGYGPHASERTFGHSGYQSSAAFADPEHNLVVAVVCNGMPGEPRHHRRARALHAAIYEDLGLG